MLIQLLFTDPLFYFAVVFAMVISIVLHELAHGYVAIKHGDDTPIVTGRMTFNPLVNVGPLSLLFLALMGFGWGSMPVDSSRLRGRYAEFWVAAAGPATNLAISILMMLIIATMSVMKVRFPELGLPYDNTIRFCAFCMVLNMLLTLFNLVPVMPLDGCHMLMSIDARFRQFVNDSPGFQNFGLLAFILINFMLSRAGMGIISWSDAFAHAILSRVMAVAALFL
jgi:Zn-dependent protease